MRLTQGTFSVLPDLTDEQISKQVEYALGKQWALGIEFTESLPLRHVFSPKNIGAFKEADL